MTQPNPADPQPQPDSPPAGGGKAPAKAPAVRAGDVVEYTHHDVLTGRDVTHVGVVVRAEKGDATVAVRPLAHHHLEVTPEQITPLSADGVG